MILEIKFKPCAFKIPSSSPWQIGSKSQQANLLFKNTGDALEMFTFAAALN